MPEGADASRVLVCIETDRGPWVRALVAAGYPVYGAKALEGQVEAHFGQHPDAGVYLS
ncbi:MAG TPA: hypothetical protein VLJ59_12760 [Mycobacteriales bacterium]|nr:hypothetical protein [Mycobacteriales bacterium]